jgi:hypothetical protein
VYAVAGRRTHRYATWTGCGEQQRERNFISVIMLVDMAGRVVWRSVLKEKYQL